MTNSKSVHQLEEENRQLKRRIEALHWQVVTLADRLTVAITECRHQREIAALLDGEPKGAEWQLRLAEMLVSDDDDSRYRQAQIRGSEYYDESKGAVREWLRGILRDLKVAA